MARFVDRQHELQGLQDLWGMRFQLALLWGRRRVGKTRLLDEFASGKPAITFQADEGTATEQLARLTDRLLAYREDALLRAQPLANWDAAVATILRMAREAKGEGHPLLMIFDEFPRLVVSHPRLSSVLQAMIEDVRREDLPLFLVLAGSQIGLFEQHVLHGPIYGRRTWGEQLPPLGHRDAGEFFPGWSAADRLRAWALLGGVPYYLEQFDPGRGLRWNVESRLLSKGAVLYDEAELLVKEELGTDASTYMSVLSAVASGATRQSEIGDKAGIGGSAASKYLSQLDRLHMVEHRSPAGAAANARRGLWTLADHYLRAWFELVRANRTDLEARRVADVWTRRVGPRLDQFVSKPAFEDAVREHARDSIGSDPEFPAQGAVGAWWGPVPDPAQPGSRRTVEREIELVVHDGHALVLAGEAKWTKGPVDGSALAQLRGTVVHSPGYDPAVTRLALYARDGFDARVQAVAAADGIILRTVEDMYL